MYYIFSIYIINMSYNHLNREFFSNRYADEKKSHANMMEKAKLMLENDLSNLEKKVSSSGLSQAALNQLISSKIKRLVDEKKRLLETLAGKYNSETVTMSDRHNLTGKSDHILNNQKKEILRNDKKLNALKSDILTLRRQLQISESDYRKKSLVIFFLKNIFIFLLISILIALLVKNGNIPQQIGVYVSIAVAVFFTIVVLYNMYIHSNRNSVIFTKLDFETPTRENITDTTA
jgi:hypothetical protein